MLHEPHTTKTSLRSPRSHTAFANRRQTQCRIHAAQTCTSNLPTEIRKTTQQRTVGMQAIKFNTDPLKSFDCNKYLKFFSAELNFITKRHARNLPWSGQVSTGQDACMHGVHRQGKQSQSFQCKGSETETYETRDACAHNFQSQLQTGENSTPSNHVPFCFANTDLVCLVERKKDHFLFICSVDLPHQVSNQNKITFSVGKGKTERRCRQRKHL